MIFAHAGGASSKGAAVAPFEGLKARGQRYKLAGGERKPGSTEKRALAYLPALKGRVSRELFDESLANAVVIIQMSETVMSANMKVATDAGVAMA